MNDDTFEFESLTESSIRKFMNLCNDKGHFQQAMYSISGACFTNICFICRIIRSNYRYYSLGKKHE